MIVGTESGTAFITDTIEVGAYDRRFTQLESAAVFGDEAAQVFARVADDYRALRAQETWLAGVILQGRNQRGGDRS